MKPTSPQARGYLLAIIAALGTAIATIVGKWNLTWVSPTVMNAGIFTVASVIFTAQAAVTRRHEPRSITTRGWLLLVGFCVCSILAIWLFWAGLQRMDPTLAAFLNRSEVILTIMLAIVFLHERFTWGEALGAALCIAGIVLLRLTLRLEFSIGFWLVLTGAVFAGINEFIAKVAVRHVPIRTIMWFRSLILAAVFWLILAARNEPLAGLQTVWPGILLLGVVGPVLARLAYMNALKLIPLTRTAVVAQTYPVFVLLLSLAVWGQVPTLREMAGGMVIVIGCSIMILTREQTQDTLR
jgi:drug/metabolite transporter (DMT)-like permease